MKYKRENCKYCGEKMEAKTTRAEFCSNKCRVYWNRENVTEVVKENNRPKNKKKIQERRDKNVELPKEVKNPLPPDECTPPMPKREDFKDNWDYLEAKNEWKKKHNI